MDATDRDDAALPLDGAVISLDDPSASSRSTTGGKGANLARLVGEGWSVPDGVCVTTAVYDRIAADPAIAAAITELEAADPDATEVVADRAANLRDRIRNHPLPAAVSESLAEFIDPDERYAVRSSATAEDLPTASFAGQHETVLDCAGTDAILDAVSECLASLFTDRAVSYRATNDIPHGDVSMAVVVQRMVDADVSGVLFTADALSGNRTIASIDAAPGLGEAVVSGTTTADNVRVDRKTKTIIEYRTEGSVERSDERAEQNRVLSDEQVLALVGIGEEVERIFEMPQDIEWSIVDGEIRLLQSRAITSLFPIPSPPPEDDGLHVYYSYNHRQGMTDPMPPLSVDYVRRYTEWTLTRLTAYDPSTFSPTASAGGLVYLDVTPMLRSSWLAPKWLDGIAELDEPAVSLQRELAERRGEELADASAIGGRSPRAYLIATWRLGRVAGVGIARTVQGALNREYERFPARDRAWYERYVAETVDEIRAGETEAERIRLAVEASSTFGWVATRSLTTSAGFLSKSLLTRLCPGHEDAFEALDKGRRDNVTIAMVLELGDIADLARDRPRIVEAIVAGEGLDEIRRIDGSEEFVAAFERFLDAYGHRGSAELDPSQPRYREDPSPLFGTIRSTLVDGEAGAHRERFRRLEADAESAIEDLERAADRGVLGPLRRRLVRPLAARYRSFKATRETPKYAYTYLWAEFRAQVLAAGDRLEREGRVESADDVWLFRLDELLSALDHPDASIEVEFDERRTAHRRNRDRRAPRVITSDGEIPRPTALEDERDDHLVGVATSNGVAEGTARVVRDPRTETVEEGEILVAPYTDPGWTPLFLNAAGLVTDVGGVFSHGSLVAREYGIPSVVVDDATRRIETGQRLRVDGDDGVVEVVEDGSI